MKEDDDEEEDETAQDTTATGTFVSADTEMEDIVDSDPFHLDAKEIKAFWLKGQIAQHVDADPINSQRIADQVLVALEKEEDVRDCENRLVEILGYEKFDLVRVLLKNRLKILYCTKLAHAEDEQERAKIEEEMKNDPQLSLILVELNTTGKGNKKFH